MHKTIAALALLTLIGYNLFAGSSNVGDASIRLALAAVFAASFGFAARAWVVDFCES